MELDMKHIGLAAACILVSACWDGSLGDWGGGPDHGVSICVQGDAGHCCQALSGACSDGEPGCDPRRRVERTPERCIPCVPWTIDDGGMPEPFSAPPNPPPDAAIAWVDDAGVVHDAHVEVCGTATYTRY
jgi:hypothetical protein